MCPALFPLATTSPGAIVAASLVLLVLSGILLVWGGNAVVMAASGMARRFGASDFAVAATVVAVGTSLPELFVSVVAVLDGHPDIAVGNVLGSNVANIGLVLGLTGAISPVRMQSNQTRVLLLFYIALMVTLGVALWSGPPALGTTHGGVMLLVLAGVVFLLYRAPRSERAVAAGDPDDEDPVLMLLVRVTRIWRGEAAARWLDRAIDFQRNLPLAAFYLALGLLGLYFGGKGFVKGASDIAGVFGISELVIALVVVAVGTSLPEVAVSAIASLKGQGDVSLGNVVGSNVFNVLLVLGVSALVGTVPIDLRNPDMAVSFGAALFFGLALLPAAFGPRGRIGRRYGVALLLGYAAIVAWWFAGAA